MKTKYATVGKPRKFKDGETFLKAVEEYAIRCNDNDRQYNVAGFARSVPMNRDTYYAQKEYYPEEFGIAQVILEDELINGTAETGLKKLLLFNVLGQYYKDKQELHTKMEIKKLEDLI
jgi:hypothetical protein